MGPKLVGPAPALRGKVLTGKSHRRRFPQFLRTNRKICHVLRKLKTGQWIGQ